MLVRRDFHKALAERKQGEVHSLEKGLQKQLADTSHRNAAWGQKELALSSDHVSIFLWPCGLHCSCQLSLPLSAMTL